MKISVAVPSYNYARFLNSCLESIKNQDYANFEVLICDGGSTDGSLEIIQDYCSIDDRFKLVSTQDNGQSAAIDKAFQISTGDILCFLNADDCYLCLDAFSSVIDTFKMYRTIGLLSFGGYFLNADGFWLKPIRYRYHPFDGAHWMRYRTAVLQPATFWRAEVYRNTPWPVNFNFVFDVVFFYSAYEKYSWLELSKAVAGYRLHGNNKSMTVRANRIHELAKFEGIKFGVGSFREKYLNIIAVLIGNLQKRRLIGNFFTKFVYYFVNGLSYLTFYRLPGI
jgi:glycosyltransferase involved in cell wall biosynthesis